MAEVHITKETHPELWAMIQTEEGRRTLEAYIARRIWEETVDYILLGRKEQSTQQDGSAQGSQGGIHREAGVKL